jgi:glucose/arabinose dehydrogenase
VPPSGYRLSLIKFNENNDAYDAEEFLGGFIKDLEGNFLAGSAGCGRPVDLLELPDGSVLFSDDMGNKIYRIVYEEVK